MVEIALPFPAARALPRLSLRAANGWRTEALLIAGLYLASEATRGIADGSPDVARRHAADVVGIERHLGVFHEAGVQSFVHSLPALPSLLGYAYITLHLLVTASVLAWVYRNHRRAYPVLRNALIAASSIAIVVYWLFPTAPPRLAGVGIADTVSAATTVDLSSQSLASFYNPFAAVPSMHIGFAVLVAVTVAHLSTRRSVRVLALAYPLFVLLVIVATGNHFLFDAAAGAVVAGVALAAARLGSRA
jgi:PAP2 superfamily protein